MLGAWVLRGDPFPRGSKISSQNFLAEIFWQEHFGRNFGRNVKFWQGQFQTRGSSHSKRLILLLTFDKWLYDVLLKIATSN